MSNLRLSMVARHAAIAALMSAWALGLQAQTPPSLQVVPTPAYSATLLSVSVQGLPPCSRLTGSEVARQGQTLTLTLRYEVLSLCVPIGTPPPPAPWVLPLGALESGQYTLVLVPIERTLGVEPSSTINFEVAPGALAGPTPITVPMGTSWTLAALVGILAAIGALALGGRGRLL